MLENIADKLENLTWVEHFCDKSKNAFLDAPQVKQIIDKAKSELQLRLDEREVATGCADLLAFDAMFKKCWEHLHDCRNEEEAVADRCAHFVTNGLRKVLCLLRLLHFFHDFFIVDLRNDLLGNIVNEDGDGGLSEPKLAFYYNANEASVFERWNFWR